MRYYKDSKDTSSVHAEVVVNVMQASESEIQTEFGIRNRFSQVDTSHA